MALYRAALRVYRATYAVYCGSTAIWSCGAHFVTSSKLFVTWNSEAKSWKPSGRFPRTRRNKLILAGEKKEASQSPTGVPAGVNMAQNLGFFVLGTRHERDLRCSEPVHLPTPSATLGGTINPHADATDTRAMTIASTFVGAICGIRTTAQRQIGTSSTKQGNNTRNPRSCGLLFYTRQYCSYCAAFSGLRHCIY